MIRRFDLGGTWTVAPASGGEALPARVPGCIHKDLLASRRIEDPYYRDNETRVQWVGETDWEFSREFELDPELLEKPRVLLRCEGLDTFATIRLNGRIIARTDNAHRTWEFDVRPHLTDGVNRLAIRFDSAVRRGAELRAAAERVPFNTWNICVPGADQVRRAACGFGWDWGPKLVTCGITRRIELVAFDTVRLHDVLVRQKHAGDGSVEVNVAISAQRIDAAPLTAWILLGFEGALVAGREIPVVGNSASAALVVRDPRLWWPNGMGGQPLYDLRVELRDAAGRVVDFRTRRIGLRTLALQRNADQWGESFAFVANGVPFFAKGANWIPPDSFPAGLLRTDYAPLLQSAVAANMNMLRVWGGGVFEHDDFYDLCDELGLCVWQDFMFTCSSYPAYNDRWIASVEAEARDAVRRLRHHACLALWCGNNEIEMYWVADQWTPDAMDWESYSRLFDRLLPDIVAELDPDRDYWPSSPHTPGDKRRDFNNPDHGDAHLWTVWHGREPFEWYRTATHRFCSEFGFQSFPEPRTVETFTEPRDRNITSFVMEHHQRSGPGNALILHYMLSWFRMPTGFEATLRLSQILQGLAMKYAVEHWRRSMPRCMGTLYWQLNDCWPAASWSSIDSLGRWKALHFMARDFYAPLLVSGVEDPARGTVEIHATSDALQPARCEVRWTVTTADGDTPDEGRKPVRLAPRANRLVTTLRLAKLLERHGPRNLLVWLELHAADKLVSSNLVLFTRPKHIDLPDPAIGVAVEPAQDMTFTVALTARRNALWVWLELEGADATFSDNYFHLRAGQTRTVVARQWHLSADEFSRRLRIRSLVDTTG
ncbi:MAG: glycoside hydrolase family 2 protein [Candidatus Sumerlaeia bacterium]|nr:glycoside hydrolase family 2 protein [Candidatus Sumerlaeia bacterium]